MLSLQNWTRIKYFGTIIRGSKSREPIGDSLYFKTQMVKVSDEVGHFGDTLVDSNCLSKIQTVHRLEHALLNELENRCLVPLMLPKVLKRFYTGHIVWAILYDCEILADVYKIPCIIAKNKKFFILSKYEVFQLISWAFIYLDIIFIYLNDSQSSFEPLRLREPVIYLMCVDLDRTVILVERIWKFISPNYVHVSARTCTCKLTKISMK